MRGGDGVTVLVTGSFSVPADNIRWLRANAPEIATVELVVDRDQLCTRASAAGRAVGIVDAATPELPVLAERFGTVAVGGILAVTANPAEDHVVGLFARGVTGVVLTSSPAEELVTAIRGVASGHWFAPPRYLAALAETVVRNPRGPRARHLRELLTERELEVLLLLASGSANQEIADALGISVTTVRSHVLSILRKLNVPNRTVAAICAYRSGLAGV
ncbi:response regulator transcription factor [Amycolatopsis sp.]|uniref:response regulator transcription factor n=1 Tax=Amycolatopsis sp. TaxID=37632 RepID=UPI002D804C2F|nr:response regulator transcription factor [Amycolatopsis sp.]HET6708799.1 response regulator transcription factor [Amycolatopsis sp.]